MTSRPAPQIADPPHRVGSFVTDLSVTGRDGPLSTPERLAQQVRIELLPALPLVFEDSALADCDARVEVLEIDIGRWPADPDWAEVREAFRLQLLAALMPYLRKGPAFSGGAGSATSEGDAAAKVRQPAPRLGDTAPVAHLAEHRAATAAMPRSPLRDVSQKADARDVDPAADPVDPTDRLAIIDRMVPAGQADALAVLRSAAEQHPTAFERALRALPSIAHRQRLLQLISDRGGSPENRLEKTSPTPRRGLNLLQTALVGIFETMGHAAQTSRQMAATLTARLLIHPVGGGLTAPSATAGRIGVAHDGLRRTGKAQATVGSDTSPARATAPASNMMPPASGEGRDIRYDAEALRMLWQNDRSAALAQLRSVRQEVFLRHLHQLVPSAAPPFFEAVERLKADAEDPRAALVAVVTAILDNQPVDLEAARAGQGGPLRSDPAGTAARGHDHIEAASPPNLSTTGRAEEASPTNPWAEILVLLSAAGRALSDKEAAQMGVPASGVPTEGGAASARREAGVSTLPQGQNPPTISAQRQRFTLSTSAPEAPDPSKDHDIVDDPQPAQTDLNAADAAALAVDTAAMPAGAAPDLTANAPFRHSKARPGAAERVSRQHGESLHRPPSQTPGFGQDDDGDDPDRTSSDLRPPEPSVVTRPAKPADADAAPSTASVQVETPPEAEDTQKDASRPADDPRHVATDETPHRPNAPGGLQKENTPTYGQADQDASSLDTTASETPEKIARTTDVDVRSARESDPDLTSQDQTDGAHAATTQAPEQGQGDRDASDAPTPQNASAEAAENGSDSTTPGSAQGEAGQAPPDKRPPENAAPTPDQAKPAAGADHDYTALAHLTANAAADALAEAAFGTQAATVRAILDMIWQATPGGFRPDARWDVIAGAHAKHTTPDPTATATAPPAGLLLDLIAAMGTARAEPGRVLHHALTLIAPDRAVRTDLIRHLIARLSYPMAGSAPALRQTILRHLDDLTPQDPTPPGTPAHPRPAAPEAISPRHRILTQQAGLVLFHPFYKLLLSRLDLLTEADALHPDQLDRGLAAMAALAGVPDPTAPADPTARLLLGVPADLPLPPPAPLNADELQLIDGLIRSVIAQWSKLGQTTPAGLQDAFIRRGGHLRFDSAGAHLHVDPGPFDVLLDGLPWALDTVIALPWMPVPCHVSWRAQDG